MLKILADRERDWFIPVLVLLLVFILAARSPLDTDMWWHLRAGEQTWTTGRPMLLDTFSFTRFGVHWINHSWLSEAGMYLLFKNGGFLALGGAMAFLATLSMGIVYFQMSGPAIFRAFLLILGSAVTAVVWSPRPQLMSLVLLAVLSTIFFLYKWKGRNHIKWLPVIFLLWGNLHGGFAIGFILIGSFIAGEITNHLLGNTSNVVLAWKQIGQMIIWSLVSAFAILVNPNGLDIWKIPFQTVEVSTLPQFIIQEWTSPDFHELYQQPFLWLLFAILAAAAFSRRRMDGSDFVTVIVFAIMGLLARRNFGPFGIVALPVLSRTLWPSIQSLRTPNTPEPPWQKDIPSPAPKIRPLWQRRVNLAIVGFLALVAFGKLFIVTYPAVMEAATAAAEPVGAADWLVQNHAQGRLFDEYNWGGYLAWRMSEPRIFVDGRTDLFGDEILGEWITTVQAGDGWQQILAKWDVNYVMVDPSRPLVKILPENGWKLLYQDSLAIIYGK
ncbi:MAG TPA: hypothetical protein VMS73_05340 [Anaerolineaceae bacterium]|nr:hypothetical protein [Anaerolineaceae bacterium]